MKPESEQYLGLLERRLALLDSLVKTLAESRADFIALDLEAIHARIREQEQFCSQIQSLDREITSAQIRCAKISGIRPRANEISWPSSDASDPAVMQQIRTSMQRIAAAQAELKRLNDAHQAMLRRSRRTVSVLLNLFQSHAPTYAAPSPLQTGTMCEERV